MKVLFICNKLSYGGGAERVLTILANKLSGLGNSIVVLTKDVSNSYSVSPSVKLIVLGTKIGKISFIKSLRANIQNENPDTIISFEYFINCCTILASLNLHKKVIVSERNDPNTVGGSFPKKQIRNLLYTFCDVLVCQTQDAADYFPKRIRKKSTVIMNPITDSLPQRSNEIRRHEIVSFCRLHPQKNLQLLILAFSDFVQIHPDYTLKIFGDGPEKEKLQRLIEEKEMQGKISIFPSQKNIHELVLNSAMFILPSNFEGLSNSMLEALAIGLPTICTDCPCGGARSVIQDGVNGLLVPVGDKKALTEAMCKIADNNEFANSLSERSIDIKELLSADNISKKWMEIMV